MGIESLDGEEAWGVSVQQLTQTMFTGVGEQVGDAKLFGQLAQLSIALVIEKPRIQPVLLAAVLYR
ncbi:hypothetical protein [Aeromonas veronii]|uniref:hypothetical protein n=1 Tax=Aeromonas veronii TaxID=654 RepID=UPI0039F5903C